MKPKFKVKKSFEVRANRINAISKLSQIILYALELSNKNPESDFLEYFEAISKHIPDIHHTNQKITLTGYKAVGFMDSLALISTITEMELFFQEVVVATLTAYPHKIRDTHDTKVGLEELMKYSSIEDILIAKAESYANAMMFKSPKNYKKELLEIISADRSLLDEFWPKFIEAKARRDLGVHNDWKVNDIYINKIREVKLTPTTDSYLAVDFEYLQEVKTCCLNIMEAIIIHYFNKFS